jgi:hypothetical protein
MDFLVSDGGERGDHHVEAVKPRPVFDVVIAGGTDHHDQQEKRADSAQVAKGGHGSCQLSAISLHPEGGNAEWSLGLGVGKVDESRALGGILSEIADYSGHKPSSSFCSDVFGNPELLSLFVQCPSFHAAVFLHFRRCMNGLTVRRDL